jgi:hypothetical protein
MSFVRFGVRHWFLFLVLVKPKNNVSRRSAPTAAARRASVPLFPAPLDQDPAHRLSRRKHKFAPPGDGPLEFNESCSACHLWLVQVRAHRQEI